MRDPGPWTDSLAIVPLPRSESITLHIHIEEGTASACSIAFGVYDRVGSSPNKFIWLSKDDGHCEAADNSSIPGVAVRSMLRNEVISLLVAFKICTASAISYKYPMGAPCFVCALLTPARVTLLPSSDLTSIYPDDVCSLQLTTVKASPAAPFYNESLNPRHRSLAAIHDRLTHLNSTSEHPYISSQMCTDQLLPVCKQKESKTLHFAVSSEQPLKYEHVFETVGAIGYYITLGCSAAFTIHSMTLQGALSSGQSSSESVQEVHGSSGWSVQEVACPASTDTPSFHACTSRLGPGDILCRVLPEAGTDDAAAPAGEAVGEVCVVTGLRRVSEAWADFEYALTVRWVRDERIEQLRLALGRRGVCVCRQLAARGLRPWRRAPLRGECMFVRGRALAVSLHLSVDTRGRNIAQRLP